MCQERKLAFYNQPCLVVDPSQSRFCPSSIRKFSHLLPPFVILRALYPPPILVAPPTLPQDHLQGPSLCFTHTLSLSLPSCPDAGSK